MKKKVIIPAAMITTAVAAGAAAMAIFAKKSVDEQEKAPDIDEKTAEDKGEIKLDGIDAPEFEAPEAEAPEGTLESYLTEHPEERQSLEAVKDSFSGDGVRTDISCTGDTLFFDFVMTEVSGAETRASLKPDLETFLESQEETYAEIVSSVEEETGLTGIKMIVIFMDADEEEIVSGHYDKSGRTL